MSENLTISDRKKIIRELQKLSEEVYSLKETRRQKRPIVIEFSGSPKSGKTSCINSLELFLKRNGFRVEIIHERASVCPVYDKHSPMFNIWTSCMSISGMIGVLERKEINCDVLILDRGIFDAFCWFNWLSAKKMMETDQKEIIENFLVLDCLINRIDIVFAFSADPETSIEREFANLLTDKMGTIMNREVLSEYLNAIEATVREKKKYFHSIFEIDTTLKNQDEVGKEVTDITLRTLKDSLMEKIGYFDLAETLKLKLYQKAIFKYREIKNILGDIKFDLRNKVEQSNDYLQPIPIAVITNRDHSKILTIKKSPKAMSAESPEKDRLLLYIGGHPRYEDFTDINSKNFLSICRYTLRREVREELGVSLAFNEIEPFLIYTPNSEKSKKHIAVCFVVEMDTEGLKLRLDPNELILNKGTSRSGKFHKIEEIQNMNYESWSIEILRKCFNTRVNSDNQQINIFNFYDNENEM